MSGIASARRLAAEDTARWMAARRSAAAAVPAPPWTMAEDARLRPLAAVKRNERGALLAVAAEMPTRSYTAILQRVSLLRRHPSQTAVEQNGAEDSAGTANAAAAVRVPRVVPSVAAPVSGHVVDVSSQTVATAVEAPVAPCPVLPAAGAAPPGLAPAVPSGAKRPTSEYRLAERRKLKADLDALKQPPPADIKRRCLACRDAFLAASRFLFRCEPCRRGGDLPAQYQSASSGGRVWAGRHG